MCLAGPVGNAIIIIYYPYSSRGFPGFTSSAKKTCLSGINTEGERAIPELYTEKNITLP